MKALLLLACAAFVTQASASFHLMQVEQVIGSLNGNSAAQAVQLRMRSPGQNLVSNTKVWAADATGSNRILLLDIAADVSVSSAGSRVLLATAAFTTAVQTVTPTFSPDFTLATPIPASYLSAGRITFEDDAGTVATPGSILWSLAWGGAAYTGSNTGATTNDSNGNFGPPFASSLPTSGAQAIRFTGASSALSTTNLADYALGTNPATVVRNNGDSFVLPLVTAIETWRQTNFGTTANSGNAADDFDFDKDGLVNLIEFALGLDPKQNSAHLFPHGQIAAGKFTLSFPQPAGVSGITYGAESSTTLQAASWTPVTDTGTSGQHVFSIPIASKGFLRLKVTDP
ncbi:hypothetical protein [Luteolibacter soli]|uniref:EF-hand domain-containing protein n=1 Tax=Luteolibacter soli TaxID=3135280 RepID=A0ABU9ASP3_9BACT